MLRFRGFRRRPGRRFPACAFPAVVILALWFSHDRTASGRTGSSVLLTGYAVLNLLWQGLRSYPDLPDTDPVTIHEARINQLKPFLPASGAVGYVTTVENDRIFAAEKAFQQCGVSRPVRPDAIHPGPAHRPKLSGFPARHRQFPRRPAGAGVPGETRPGSPQGFRRRPRSLSAGEKTLIILFSPPCSSPWPAASC